MVDSSFSELICEVIERKNWPVLEEMFKERDKVPLSELSCSEFAIKIPESNNRKRTILQMACSHDVQDDAKEGVQLILKYMTPTSCLFDEFLNSKDFQDETALDIAIRMRHGDVVDLLLAKNANIQLRFDPKMNGLCFKVLLIALNKGLSVDTDVCDETNEYQWTVKCNFKLLESCTLGETKLLVKTLDLPRARRRKILTHPLVQLYLLDKWTRFKWLRRCSIILNCLWYLMSAVFVFGSMLGFNNPKNSTQNDNIRLAYTWWFYLLVFIFFFIYLYLQGTKFWISPSRKYSIKQLQNWGHLGVLCGVAVMGTTRFLLHVFGYKFGDLWEFFQWPLIMIYTIGLLSSLFLVQGLCLKTDSGGLYNHMMIKSFHRLLKFIFAFGGLVFAYAIMFNTLHSDDLTFSLSPKTLFLGVTRELAMQTGEINLKDAIPTDKIHNMTVSIPTNALYLSFILTVVLILNTMWVGFAVVDTEKSRRKAIAAHAASCLEAIFLMESFILELKTAKMYRRIFKMDWIVQQLYSASELYKIEIESSLPMEYEYDFPFVNIPKPIRKGIYKIPSILPRGYVEDEDSDLSD